MTTKHLFKNLLIVASAYLWLVSSANSALGSQRIALPKISGLRLAPGGGLARSGVREGHLGGNGVRVKNLPAESIKNIKGVCLDLHRPYPTPGEGLSSVVYGAGWRVKIGEKVMSLERAVLERKLRIEATGGTNLRIINLTDKEMSIDSDGPAVLSASRADNLDDFGGLPEQLKEWTLGQQAPQEAIWDVGGGIRERRFEKAKKGEMPMEEFIRSETGIEVCGRVESPDGLEFPYRKGDSYFILSVDLSKRETPFETLRLDVLRDGKALTPETRQRMRVIEGYQFKRAAEASMGARSVLIFGTPVDDRAPVPFQYGAVTGKLDFGQYMDLMKGIRLPEPIAEIVERSTADTIVIWKGDYQDEVDRFFGDEVVKPGVRIWDVGNAAKLLEQRFSAKRIALDNDDTEAFEHLNNIPEVAGGKDLTVVDDAASLPEGHKAMITRIRQRVEKAGPSDVKFVTADQPGVVESTNLIVLSGHKDQPFKDLIQNLFDAGKLRGKVVVFLSCGVGQEDDFNRGLLKHPDGPRAIYYYTEEVLPAAIEPVLRRVLQAADKSQQPARLKKLFEEAIEAEIRNSEKEGEPKEHQDELRKLRGLIEQVRYLEATYTLDAYQIVLSEPTVIFTVC